MDFIDKLQVLAARIPKQLEYCQTEEATKNALILPFINALGYDVFNPAEVVPEFTADIGTKKGEKVDYAIMQDEKPIILFECKWSGADLSREHASQLFRYFGAVHEVRFGVLTNGVMYQFYSDLESPNRMDDKSFLDFNILDFDDRQVNELKKFSQPSFDLDEILNSASELKYTAAIQRIIASDFDSPSDELVRYYASQVYSGRMTKSAREQFSDIVRKALRRFMNDRISDRLKTALNNADGVDAPSPVSEVKTHEEIEEDELVDEEDGVTIVRHDKKRGIFTTAEEIEGYFAVKSILRDAIDINRVHMRDGKTYCAVLLDDNNRKPICRMRFDGPRKYLGLIDNDKKESRLPIETINDIYQFSEQIVTTVSRYDAAHPVSLAPSDGARQNSPRSNYTGTQPTAVIFMGNRFPVNSWKEALFAFLAEARTQNPSEFDTIAVKMVGRKRPYITTEPSQLRSAELIQGSELYVETNLGAKGIAKLCANLSAGMGNSPEVLKFDVE